MTFGHSQPPTLMHFIHRYTVLGSHCSSSLYCNSHDGVLHACVLKACILSKYIKCISAIHRMLYTTAMYVSSSSFVYLCFFSLRRFMLKVQRFACSGEDVTQYNIEIQRASVVTAFYTLHCGSVRGGCSDERFFRAPLCCKTMTQTHCRIPNCTGNSPETDFSHEGLKNCINFTFSILHCCFQY